MQFTDQIAVITGGGSGMGAETARQLVQAGMRVAVLDRNLATAQQTAQPINAIAIACDVTNASDVAQAFAQIESQLGIPRVCINCAGICPGQLIVSKEGASMPLEDFIPAIQINLIGTFNVLRVAAARMATLPPLDDSGERGVIINTASIAAFEGQIGQIAYSASKGGVVAMTLPAARELARYGIRVMAIAPGLIETPMLRDLPDKVRDNLAASIPFPKRFGSPVEYAKLAMHIVENPMLNGSVIRLDGALRMAPK